MTTSEPAAGNPAARLVARLLGAQPHELPAALAGFLLFFLVFSSYFMLRPVRETMGIAGGVDNLQWLFSGTFVATLAVVPFYGWLSSRVARAKLLPWSYGVVAASLVAFAAGMWASPENVWLGRAFYIWLSVLNLFVISIAWSLMADAFRSQEAKRVFGQIAAGASLGGLAGPLISGLLVGTLGHPGLLLLSACLLISSLEAVRRVLAWRRAQGDEESRGGDPAQPIGGGVLQGLSAIAASPYLLAIAAFVLLLTSVSTFLYFEQARIVEATFTDRASQTQAFSAIDAVVQGLTIAVQLLVTGRLTRKLGVTVLLTAVPVAMVLVFGVLSVIATFPVLVVAMILRRVGEYALVRPGREMLFASANNATKYKAKNAIDTVVYRGGDALSAWLNTAVGALGPGAAVALVGAAIAAAWAGVGLAVGRAHERRAGGGASGQPAPAQADRSA